MAENETNYEQSIWKVKINADLLYQKSIDGIPVLLKMTEEENKEIEEILNKTVQEAVSVLSTNEWKREKLAGEKPSKSSVWEFRINSQILFKKTLSSRTILFGMNEKDYAKVTNILDGAFVNLGEVLKDRTVYKEAVEKEVEDTNMDAVSLAQASLNNSNGIEEEIEQAKKELEEVKAEAEKQSKTNEEKAPDTKEESEPITEKIKEATKNDLREKVQENKSSEGSFWDNLK